MLKCHNSNNKENRQNLEHSNLQLQQKSSREMVFSLWKGLASILVDFSAWTSTHGIPHIGLSKATWLRIVWVVIFAFCSSMFFLQIKGLIQKYFSYPVNVDTALLYGERVFPMVTLCNLNAYKMSVASEGIMKDLINAYQASGPDSTFGFTDTTFDRKQRAFKWMNMMYNDLVTEDEQKNTTYSYADLFISCSYNTENCNETDFSTYVDPYFGRCYSFNYDSSKTSSRAGPLYGLNIVLRVNQAEYLPWTQSAGAAIQVLDQSEHPFVYTDGFFTPVGVASAIGVSFVSQKKLAHPYSSCSDVGGDQTVYYDTPMYQLEACIRSCLQDKIVATCDCYDATFPYTGNETNVNCYQASDPNSKVDCILNITSTDGKTGFNVNEECSCPQSCSESTYNPTLSTAFWPATQYTPQECVTPNNDYLYWDPNDRPSCKNWYGDNTVYLEIYYERMNYQVLTESPAYAFINLVSDTGGQVGLWLGMSVISCIEFLTLIVLLICYCLTRPKDAYLPQFDEAEEQRQREQERKMREKQEKLFGRKMSNPPNSQQIYSTDEHMDLPPKVQEPN
ncbi:hypothetical protein FO519_001007 [Halicephalobus sp. NKZ332]|nr:hypothetical protein FO519_001007 [Halicephalobus sp. NKZ332]